MYLIDLECNISFSDSLVEDIEIITDAPVQASTNLVDYRYVVTKYRLPFLISRRSRPGGTQSRIPNSSGT